MKSDNFKNRMLFTQKNTPNFHVEINPDGAAVWVSLNITPAMVKHLSPNNVFKAEQMYIYCLRKQMDVVNFKQLETTYKTLLNRAMINCRIAKKKVIDEQILILSN